MANHPPAHIGSSIDEIDTPALVIDLDAYERNLDRMASKLKVTSVRLRPHAKTHKCAVIAHHQIARGAVGVCCQKVSEAEALIEGGVRDVLVSNQVVGTHKLARLVALAKRATVAVCVDDAENVAALGTAAKNARVQLPVLVEIDVGAGRCGVAPGQPALALARQIAANPSLRFAGLQAYHGKAQHIYDLESRQAAIQASIDSTRATVELMRSEGLPCLIVTGAGTGTFAFETASGVYTELQAGSYIFMDADYRRVAGSPQEFEQALFVLTTIMSRPTPDRAVCDAGLKAHSVDTGLPVIHGRTYIEYVNASDEHGTLQVTGTNGLNLGNKLWLIPGHCDPTVNLYNHFVGVRRGRVESIWPIVARGAVW
jgi:3-hydroxy-D-aspartate aldolase